MLRKSNLEGQRFGMLVVQGYAGSTEDGRSRSKWYCKCDCGNMKIVRGDRLTSGSVTNCGCVNQKKHDSLMVGRRFGKLTVLRRGENNSRGEVRWVCRCDCGKETLVTTANLNTGNSKSCGCTRGVLKHGGAINSHVERLYHVWLDMKKRCNNHNAREYSRYGGRGISVCEEWASDYDAFRRWSLSNGYNQDAEFGECTIDRIDNNKGYSPDNCRWANMTQQGRNKSNNHFLHIDGEYITISQASERYGIPYDTLWARIKRGWPDADAVIIGRMSNQWG